MRFFASLLILILIALPTRGWSASDQVHLSKGQTVYVPVYSNVFSGPRSLPFQLAATLSVRNSDMDSWLHITSIDYYDTSGKLIRRYQDKPLSLAPLASTYVHIEEKDVAGGFGANFIVKWQADRTVNAPIIECVMIGATSGQGISFVSPGQPIRPTAR